ncbi:spore coat protein [Niallia sp. JL1B1071]|uniref:spore coat protein n=1 Tax=Niallia tiangongensis TaxID=3237105 RepID=UPI0037DCC043
MNYQEEFRGKHLAWHETLEIHELTAAQSTSLLKLKETVGEISDSELKDLYIQSINSLSANITELLDFYPMTPREDNDNETIGFRNEKTPFQAGDLLGMYKASIKNYATALTETATPALRKILKKHLDHSIDFHAKVFHFMHKNKLYPAYNIHELLQNDVNMAKKALNKSYK